MSEYSTSDSRAQSDFVLHTTTARRLALSLAHWIFRGVMELDIHGLEHIPQEGAFILASNHVNNFDVFAMQLALPRTIFFMAKVELFNVPILGAVLANFGAFPVNRGEKDPWALEHARRVLDAGQVLGMFPEGHRSNGKGLGTAKTGSARLAISTGCPVIPMALVGTERVLKGFPRRPRVGVTFLPPVYASPGESPESLTERLMFTLAAALPASMRGLYANLGTPSTGG